MCLCCLGWGVFLYNWYNGEGRAPTAADVKPNVQILGAQGVFGFLDHFFWTIFLGLSGNALWTATFVFDVAPLLAQAAFVGYVWRTAQTPVVAYAVVDQQNLKGCCGGEKETMLV
mmetsp:Transcript_25769/g.77380  ORF Transcript_25769/g.77380 Transcript_25769/m.77380 type:complete len:115 (+) Transcript_25769:344-688(+)